MKYKLILTGAPENGLPLNGENDIVRTENGLPRVGDSVQYRIDGHPVKGPFDGYLPVIEVRRPISRKGIEEMPEVYIDWSRRHETACHIQKPSQ